MMMHRSVDALADANFKSVSGENYAASAFATCRGKSSVSFPRRNMFRIARP